VFVAQAAAAVFQVGFELAEAFLFGVTRALFLLFVADVGSFGNERRTGGVDGVRLARQLAVFQQAGEEVYVGGGGRGEVAVSVDVLRDVQTELPECLDEGFDGVAVGEVVRGEEQEVDVGGGEEFAAAVAADLTLWVIGLSVLALAGSLLLVSELPMFSLKVKSMAWQGNERRYLLLISAVVLTLAMPMLTGISATILLYILLSIFDRKAPEAESPT